MTEEKIEDNAEEPLSEEELKELEEYAASLPNKDASPNVHTFLHNVVEAKDTTKLGNLDEEELGDLRLTLRACKDLWSFSKTIMNNQFLADYFNEKAEIQTSTSLSKRAKLLDLSVVQRKEVADKTPRVVKENKGWFKKKSSSSIEQ